MKTRHRTFAHLAAFVFIAVSVGFPVHAAERDIVFECPCEAEYVAGEEGEGELTISFGIRSHRATTSGEIRLQPTLMNQVGDAYWQAIYYPYSDVTQVVLPGEIPGRSAAVGQLVSVPVVLRDEALLEEVDWLQIELYEQLARVPKDSYGWPLDNDRTRHEILYLWPVPREDASSGTLRFVDILTDTDGDGVGDFNEQLAGTSPVDAADTPGGATTIDVLAFYDEASRQQYGDAALVRIHHVLAVADTVFVDSGTNIRLRGVGASLLPLSQSEASNDYVRDEPQLALAGADMKLIFYTEPNLCWGLPGCAGIGSNNWRPNGAWLGMTSGPLIAVHELGHAMGLVHSARQGDVHGAFRWSRGHYVLSTGGRPDWQGTIMSYGRHFDCIAFSDPDARCRGRPIGLPADHPEGADARKSLDLMRFQIGAYRPAKPDSDGDGFVDPLDALPADPREWFDSDGDGEGDNVDPDDDNDGVPDAEDAFPLDAGEWADADDDGVGDNRDEDVADEDVADEDVADGGLVPDAALRALVREALGKPPNAPLTETDLQALKVLKGRDFDPGIRDLTGLELATNLEVLELRNGLLADLHPLSGLENLKILNLSHNKISDLSPLTGLENLEDLSLFVNSIVDLSPLAGLENLKILNLSHNKISDLSPLTGLENLEYLTLSDNNSIVDLSPLAGLENLEALYLFENNIVDLSPLAGLENLEDLFLFENNIVDLSPLAGLENLEYLSLSDNKISDLSPLAGLENLVSLNLSHNKISDLSPLTGLENLERLHIYNNNIRLADVLSLPYATNSSRFDLSWLDIEDVSPLGRLTGLVSLNLRSNRVSDISALVQRSIWNTGHSTLYLIGNPLSHASIHEHIPVLRSWGVNVFFDESDVVIPDAALRAIVAHSVAGNSTYVDSPLTEEAMARLWGVHAFGAGVADLTGLEAATGLQRLYLGNNAVSDLAPLRNLTNLTQLFLSDNRVRDLSPLVDNPAFAEGALLTLDGNPLSEESVNEHVPALMARGVRVRLESVSIDVEVAGDATEFDATGYFEALLGPGFGLEASGENPAIAEAAVEDGVLRVTPGEVGGTTSVTLTATSGNGGSAAVVFRIENRLSRAIAFFPRAGSPLGQGLVRIINRSDTAGEVRIEATDDDGGRARALTLSVGGGQAVQFSSEDLEAGNAGKGLVGGTGRGAGDWRLDVSGALDMTVLSYVRRWDGFLTAMHDLAPVVDGVHVVPIFNPASDMAQASVLRIVNPGDMAVDVTVTGTDDAGQSPGEHVRLEVPAGTARMLSTAELESGAGEGLTGALGDGTGYWRLAVAADAPLLVSSLLESGAGPLTNLSTMPDGPETGADGGTTRHLPLFLAAGNPTGQGFVRILNQGVDAASIQVHPYDDIGMGYGPVTLSVAAGTTVDFNSNDLELGNPAKGMPDGVGAGHGDWRLVLESAGNFEAHAYVRTWQGFLTTMHDVSPQTESVHRIATFNPAGNRGQASRLRIVNPGNEYARIVIDGLDDAGVAGGRVRLGLAPRQSRTVSATELESGGRGLAGKLGDGHGKWRLSVDSSRPVEVMNLLESPNGELANLSTVPRR